MDLHQFRPFIPLHKQGHVVDPRFVEDLYRVVVAPHRSVRKLPTVAACEGAFVLEFNGQRGTAHTFPCETNCGDRGQNLHCRGGHIGAHAIVDFQRDVEGAPAVVSVRAWILGITDLAVPKGPVMHSTFSGR